MLITHHQVAVAAAAVARDGSVVLCCFTQRHYNHFNVPPSTVVVRGAAKTDSFQLKKQ